MYNLPNTKLVILDYLCDNGCLTYVLARHNPLWTLVGYDTPENIDKCLPYYVKQYPKELEPENVRFINDKKIVHEWYFDVVFYRNNRPQIKSNMFINVGEGTL